MLMVPGLMSAFFILRCVGSGARSPFREAQLNVPVCRNVNKGPFMYTKSFLIPIQFWEIMKIIIVL